MWITPLHEDCLVKAIASIAVLIMVRLRVTAVGTSAGVIPPQHAVICLVVSTVTVCPCLKHQTL